MIIYFSATGNCRFAANKIAEAINDYTVSMIDVTEDIVLKDGEPLGIVTPTYFWGLPAYVDDFLGRVNIQNAEDSYIYLVATYGSTPGQIDYFVREHLKNQGLCLSASFGIKTVDNWTVMFNVNNKDKIKKQLTDEAKQIEQAAAVIKAKEAEFIRKGKMPLYLCKKAKYFYNRARRTCHFNVKDNCISCGLCAEGCPVKTIEIVDGKPKWITKSCVMCLKCLHTCPVFAIQYDNKTQKNGQYMHPKA